MRLKLYRAASMAEAMASIRADLGPEALILGSRRIGGGIEISAGLEPAFEALPEPTLRREAALAWHRVPPPLDRLLAEGPLEAALQRCLPFAPIPLTAGSEPLLLVGPPGAGKTLTVARLATRLVMAGVSPMVLTTDTRRAGAAEQLAAFTRLLGLRLIVAGHPLTLGRALAERAGGAPVLIDSPGSDPFDPIQQDELAALAATAGATVVLVLPAGLDPAEAADLATAFTATGASLLLPTRLDIVRRLGGVLAAAHAGPLALTEAGIGPGAADGLAPLTPAFLAERLLRAGRNGESHL
ncbi:MAG: GTP-binding protein [Rhodospirillales bacterium]|nr:GTP-binding protein [Rhodospirillales bacterium]